MENESIKLLDIPPPSVSDKQVNKSAIIIAVLTILLLIFLALSVYLYTQNRILAGELTTRKIPNGSVADIKISPGSPSPTLPPLATCDNAFKALREEGAFTTADSEWGKCKLTNKDFGYSFEFPEGYWFRHTGADGSAAIGFYKVDSPDKYIYLIPEPLSKESPVDIKKWKNIEIEWEGEVAPMLNTNTEIVSQEYKTIGNVDLLILETKHVNANLSVYSQEKGYYFVDPQKKVLYSFQIFDPEKNNSLGSVIEDMISSFSF